MSEPAYFLPLAEDTGTPPHCGEVVDRFEVYKFEDVLFKHSNYAHEILSPLAAQALIDDIFFSYGRELPELKLVRAFKDPQQQGYADVKNNIIYIKEDCLERFIVVHESAHFIAPTSGHDRGFISTAAELYSEYLNISPYRIYRELEMAGLPFDRKQTDYDLQAGPWKLAAAWGLAAFSFAAIGYQVFAPQEDTARRPSATGLTKLRAKDAQYE